MAYALKRRNEATDLYLWRPLAGAVAALFPYIEVTFELFGDVFASWASRGLTWSVLLLPLWSFILAFIFGTISGKGWQRFIWLVAGCMGISLFTTVFTIDGIQPFAPILDIRLRLPIIFDFDVYLFAGLLFGVIVTYLIKPFRRDIARVFLVLLVVYLIVLSSFSSKARDFGRRYADALQLKIVSINVLPQPISPLNWRVIILTDENRLHDVRLNLSAEKPSDIDPTKAKRSYRIKALYQPMDTAVWQIYNRLGRRLSEAESLIVSDQWRALQKSAFGWDARFAIYRGITRYEGQRCRMWQDIRRLGAKNKWLDMYYTCEQLDEDGISSSINIYSVCDADKATYLTTIKQN